MRSSNYRHNNVTEDFAACYPLEAWWAFRGVSAFLDRPVITVTVRLFAAYREAVGRSELLIKVPDRARVGWLVGEVVRRHPELDGRLSRAAYAVNRNHVDRDRVLADGDEVVFIPPVSGGCGLGCC